MIPYISMPSLNLGLLTIHPFGIAVAAGLWLSLTLADRRFARPGLDSVVARQLGAWILVGGAVGAHLYSVLLYFPDRIRTDPWLLLRIWEDISSVGGMLGGVMGAAVYFRMRARALTPDDRIRYLDVVAFVFPFGLALGRLGCALVHDHPGVVTRFPLAVSLQSAAAQTYISDVYAAAGRSLPVGFAQLGFHDLGLYELGFLSLVVIPAFLYLDRRRHASGFYLVAFSVAYFPVRFALDALRVSDTRYLALTPAQWAAALVLAVVPLVAMGRRRARFALTGAVILATAWACWGGSR
jgi:phosphatidylglycerol:prolipoprotein diacylglycerol transferase